MKHEPRTGDFHGEAFHRHLLEAMERVFPSGALTPAEAERLADYGAWLAEASRSVNLTRILEPEDMAVRHFLDSWHAARCVECEEGRVLDAGTGGGVPGVPIAVFRPDLEVVMIDGTGKKIALLREWIARSGIGNATALHVRLEDHLREDLRYEAALSRAAVKPESFLRLLRETGPRVDRLLFMEGSAGKQKAARIASLARAAGYGPARVEPYRLPGLERERFIVCYGRAGV